MRQRGPLARTTLALALLWAASPIHAHGLLLKLEADGAHVAGTAYFTNGEVAADEWVEWVDLDASPGAAPVGSRTDTEGRFAFDGTSGHRYRIRAYAEEGHNVELELALQPDSRPRLVNEDGETVDPWWPPPAWLVIGGLLLASIPFARFFRPDRAATNSRL